ncbi:hypothetical protein AAG570_001298 [Ranatra chinensis]|uniref:Uncharacterized protein n=1 Tax=Ranatra chinensis TaxID=642074 RepID=A0ABD0YC69_9HEMI
MDVISYMEHNDSTRSGTLKRSSSFKKLLKLPIWGSVSPFPVLSLVLTVELVSVLKRCCSIVFLMDCPSKTSVDDTANGDTKLDPYNSSFSPITLCMILDALRCEITQGFGILTLVLATGRVAPPATLMGTWDKNGFETGQFWNACNSVIRNCTSFSMDIGWPTLLGGLNVIRLPRDDNTGSGDVN